MRNRHRYLGLGIVLFLVSLAAVGCGGGGGSPGVANLGTTATTGTTTDPPTGGAPSGSAPSGSGQMMIGGSNSLKFSQCMRAHGVSNFPDPNSQGTIQIDPNSGIDPSSSTFRSAAQACQKLVGGNGPQLTPAQQAKVRQQALAFSICMRKHGVPDFPDPNFSGGHVSIHIQAQGNGSSDLNPNSPTFQAAQQACQGKLPFKGRGASTSGGAK